MKKQMFLLVLTVSAIIIPSKSTECEQRELEARYKCCIGVDADTEEVVSVVPRPEYEPDPIQIDAETHGFLKNISGTVRKSGRCTISVQSFSWQ